MKHYTRKIFPLVNTKKQLLKCYIKNSHRYIWSVLTKTWKIPSTKRTYAQGITLEAREASLSYAMINPTIRCSFREKNITRQINCIQGWIPDTVITYHVITCRSTNVDENYHMQKDTCVTTHTIDFLNDRFLIKHKGDIKGVLVYIRPGDNLNYQWDRGDLSSTDRWSHTTMENTSKITALDSDSRVMSMTTPKVKSRIINLYWSVVNTDKWKHTRKTTLLNSFSIHISSQIRLIRQR